MKIDILPIQSHHPMRCAITGFYAKRGDQILTDDGWRLDEPGFKANDECLRVFTSIKAARTTAEATP